MARREWEGLSASYRARLERGGINRQQYESGASLRAARGHAETPEHPRQAYRNPERFQGYIQKKQASKEIQPDIGVLPRLRRDAKEHFRRMLGPGGREPALYYNQKSVNRNVDRMTQEEIDITLESDPEDLRMLARGQYSGNPFHYK